MADSNNETLLGLAVVGAAVGLGVYYFMSRDQTPPDTPPENPTPDPGPGPGPGPGPEPEPPPPQGGLEPLVFHGGLEQPRLKLVVTF